MGHVITVENSGPQASRAWRMKRRVAIVHNRVAETHGKLDDAIAVRAFCYRYSFTEDPLDAVNALAT
jgi:hypothetical protein